MPTHYYSMREVAARLKVTEAFVASYVFGDGLKRYRLGINPRYHFIDDEGFAYIKLKAKAFKANRLLKPIEVA